MEKYNVCKKKENGKWWSFGIVKENPWGNPELSMKVTKELKELVASLEEGKYLNFAMFEDKKNG